MARPTGKTSACSKADAKVRLAHAEAFLTVADLVSSSASTDGLQLTNVAASLAVLAGIAAADAASCHALGQRSRGQAHPMAVALVKTIVPRGNEIANDLDRILTIKDTAQYGVLNVSQAKAEQAVKVAQRIVANAKLVLAT